MQLTHIEIDYLATKASREGNIPCALKVEESTLRVVPIKIHLPISFVILTS